MFTQQKNFSKFTVSGNYLSTDTAVTISGSNLLSVVPNSGSGIFSVVWYDATNYPAVFNDPNKEICRVTGVQGQVLNLDRGKEYTSAVNHSGSNYKMICTPTARGFNNLYYFRNPEKSYYMFEDFLFPNASSVEGWSRASAGGGASVNLAGGSYSGLFGGVSLSLPIAGTPSVAFTYGTDAYLFSSGVTILESVCNFQNLPDTGNVFSFMIGFIDANSTTPIDAATFLISSGSPNYGVLVSSNSTRILTYSSMLMTTGWHKFNIVINQDASISNYYIDDILIISVTGLLPTGAGRTTHLKFNAFRAAGETSLIVASGSIDYISLYKELQAPDSNYQATGYNFRL